MFRSLCRVREDSIDVLGTVDHSSHLLAKSEEHHYTHGEKNGYTGVRLTQVSQPKIEDIYGRNPQSIVACPHAPQEFLKLIV